MPSKVAAHSWQSTVRQRMQAAWPGRSGWEAQKRRWIILGR
jgi:hypothetical protein